jgi:hypothetical protein
MLGTVKVASAGKSPALVVGPKPIEVSFRTVPANVSVTSAELLKGKMLETVISSPTIPVLELKLIVGEGVTVKFASLVVEPAHNTCTGYVPRDNIVGIV